MPHEGSHWSHWGTSRLKANVWALLSRDELTPTGGSCHVLTRCWIMARAAKYKKHTWDKEGEQQLLRLSNTLKRTSSGSAKPIAAHSKDQCKDDRGFFHIPPVMWDTCLSPELFFLCPWVPQENHWWLQTFLRVMGRQPDYIFHMEKKNKGALGL